MLVIAIQTGPDGRVHWAGRRHDDDRPDATSGTSPADLFDAVFHALHDGEQVALGLTSPLTAPAPAPAAPAPAPDSAAPDSAVPDQYPAVGPGLAELDYLLGELGTWRPWTTVSTSLAQWKANTSILVWQAVPAPKAGPVPATAAVDSFFRHLPAARRAPATQPAAAPQPAAGTQPAVVNLAAAAARRAGLFVDPSELTQRPATITVTSP